MPRREIPQADLQRAEQMLDQGASVRSTAKETGISASTLTARFRKKPRDPEPNPEPATEPRSSTPPRRPDPKPSRKRPKTNKPSDEQLQAMLTKIAVAPSVPAGLILRCNYCANHFARTGPDVAAEMVVLAGEYPELRELLDSLYHGWRQWAWIGLLTSWMGVPILHHMAPAGVYRWVAPLAGMPPRESTPSPVPAHEHTPAGGAPNGTPPDTATAPDPPIMDLGGMAAALGGMDIDQLLAQAKAMGVDLPADLDLASILADADATPADTPAEPDLPAAESAEPAASPKTEAAPAPPDSHPK